MFFYGEVRSKEEAHQTRLDKQVSRGELGCLRVYYESFENMVISQIVEL